MIPATKQTAELPEVTVLMPTFNEADYIENTLSSIVDGNYPKDKLEIITIDGGSSDQTITKIQNFSNDNEITIKVINNPKKIVSSAMNLGIAESSNEILVWLGAHADYHHDYILNSVLTLQEENCAAVGGVIVPLGSTPMGKVIAVATSTPFGIGNAKYRSANQRQKVDTVFGGCWFKSSIVRVGGFNEEWIRNQDYELNYRLRKEVGDIILEPSIKCFYFCRNSLVELASQYFQYGYWRFKTAKSHPKSFGIRQAAPIALLVGLLISVVASFFSFSLALLVPIIYLSTNLLVTCFLALRERSLTILAWAPIVFLTIHLSWPLGFMKSCIDHLLSRSNRTT